MAGSFVADEGRGDLRRVLGSWEPAGAGGEFVSSW